MRSATSPTFFSSVVSSSGSSTSKASSSAITDSTMSSESAPNSVRVASRVTFSLSTPSCSAMTSATLPMVSPLAARSRTAVRWGLTPRALGAKAGAECMRPTSAAANSVEPRTRPERGRATIGTCTD
eukprot:CAMPEP_0171090948 /NCGR_PEP_ID=MMETSP0766_2-20121228/32154_1 /TAXON_ID=439317 /ORGANISM="Gambierdiscus australes, Strain CAWD 149" /LENGTH=126 /DNA_ID=CAMNT_0011548995 /DNA_START=128 /DNA_END=508 /DNA_ORIENTATION=-